MTLTRSLIYDLQLDLDLNLFLCCYTYLELHLDFVSNNDLDPDLSFDLDDGIDVFKHDFNWKCYLLVISGWARRQGVGGRFEAELSVSLDET